MDDKKDRLKALTEATVIKASIFDRILADAVRAGMGKTEMIKSTNWFMNKTRQLGSGVTQRHIQAESQRENRSAAYGRMFFFVYDPKWKKTLPFYDTYPLIVPIQKAKGGFLGLNFHYLPWRERAVLLDELYAVASNTRFDRTTKLIMNYRVLQKVSKTKNFIPCIKHYLGDHIRSRFYRIEASEWAIGLFLPVARFQKASEGQVWRDSRRRILMYG